MLLWFAGCTVVIVWSVFRDTAIDYRLLLAGSIVPDVVDVAFGGPAAAHAVTFSIVLLVGVMLTTQRRRTLRRRLLALPIATFCHLVLDVMWTRTEAFWWPLFGGVSFGHGGLPSFDRPLPVLVVQEAAGAIALVWAYRRFRLGEPERLTLFARTGHLGRDLRVVG